MEFHQDVGMSFIQNLNEIITILNRLIRNKKVQLKCSEKSEYFTPILIFIKSP